MMVDVLWGAWEKYLADKSPKEKVFFQSLCPEKPTREKVVRLLSAKKEARLRQSLGLPSKASAHHRTETTV